MYHVTGCIEGTVFEQEFECRSDAYNYEAILECAGATDVHVSEPDY